MKAELPFLKHSRVYTVAEVNQLVKSVLEGGMPSLILVEGEVSNCRRAVSGHIYFTLKDANSELRAVVWRSTAENLSTEIEDGKRILCLGRIRVYTIKGNYELVVQSVEERGIGALFLAFERLKRRLAEEGLFDEEHKKPLPEFPHTVAVVTSPTGAAVRDIIKTIKQRFPKVRILVYGVSVQGESAAEEIAGAIDALNRLSDVSVMIVGRGGGSLEDLWAFNEEVVARAIFRSRIPVVSAVGHEIDYTISDFVADARAKTPTAAADLVVPDLAEVTERMRNLLHRCITTLHHRLQRQHQVLKSAEKSRIFTDPFYSVHQLQRRIDDIWLHLRKDIRNFLQSRRQLLDTVGGRLNASSPLAVLERGYSITTVLGKKEPLRKAADAPEGTLIETTLAEGKLISRVESDEEKESSL